MISLIVLFTVFLGLVGMLAFFNSLRAKPGLRGNAAQNLAHLQLWLDEADSDMPTPEDIIAVFNRRAEGMKGEYEPWSDLCFVGLLPRTELPEFTVTRVSASTKDCITMTVEVQWPLCVPGVAVSVKKEAQTVECHLQADWLFAELSVELHRGLEEGRLTMGLKHVSQPRMALSLLVMSPGVPNPDSFASSVADAVHKIFGSLEMTEERLTLPRDKQLPLLPTVLVSAPEDNLSTHTSRGGKEEEQEGKKEEEEEERQEAREECVGEEEKGEGSSDECPAVLPHPTPPLTTVQEERTVPSGSDESEEELVEENKGGMKICGSGKASPNRLSPQPSPPRPHLPVSYKQPPLSPQDTEDLEAVGSGTWRRTPSYEQLQQIVLPTIDEGHLSLSGGRHSPSPRHMTMSLTGSDNFREESLYGFADAEGSFPSTMVFEVNDSNNVRHLVALSPPHAAKLRRRLSRAKKLHIYNDHTFCATHFKQKTSCAVCKEKISGVFGKQGYSCRDCGLPVHKLCHFKVDNACQHSQVHSMNLIYPESVSTVSTLQA